MSDPVIIPRSEHPISRQNIDPDALKVLYRLRQFNYIAYLVGGSVREERNVEAVGPRASEIVGDGTDAETEKALTVRTANESIVIPKDEIESRTVSKMSMMPEGLFDKLSDQEVRDLVAYLRGKQQVPLPK